MNAGLAREQVRPVAGEALVHPVAIVAIAVLLLNDHFWKAAFPGVITGKLSDFAGLAFFPLFLQAGVEIAQVAAGRRWVRSDRVLWGAMALTAVVFALVKLDTPVTDLYRVGLGVLQWPVIALASLLGGHTVPGPVTVRIWTDPTDLLALPAVLVGLAIRR